MSSSLRRVAALAAVALACLLAVALLGVSVDPGDRDPGSVRTDLRERNGSLDTYEMRVEVTTSFGDRTRRLVYRLAVDRPDRSNVTVVAPEGQSGQVILYNRSGGYIYNASEKRLVKVGETPTSGDLLARLVDLVGANRSQYRGEQRLDGSRGVVLEYDAGGENVSLRIGGSPPEQRFLSAGRFASANASVWVDPERSIPVRVNRTFSADGTDGWMRLRVLEFRPNVTFESGRFRIDSPPGTTVEDTSNTTEYYDSRDAMVRDLDRRVPDPSVPPSLEFERGTLVRLDDGRIVGLQYRGGRRRALFVQAIYGNGSAFDPDGQPVQLDGVTGQYVNESGYGAVVWECGSVRYTVGGSLDREGLLSVARSIGCPDPGGGRSGNRSAPWARDSP